ncbi:hypothetical protein CBR_g50992 [Chara braunii]|uniref:BED-type domain-containing protein n=1 Tax=Chara braunii TaxID=69332 RepID=A0A388M7T1_CHABU|nr:hypothetical protein CBR_g50992 [Chara braunii]|eukprot:GBG90644.1 hypothetical protein CBR_g50992 [Chara braunii]
MTGGAGGSGGNNFVPASDVVMDELRRKSRVWRHVTQGQRMGTWEKRHGDNKLRCNYCKHVWQGNLFKAQRHFTQLKRCTAVMMDVFVDIWNHTDYEFENQHHRGIVAYMREHDTVDRRVVDTHKRQRLSTLDEVYDPDGQAAFRDTFLQWCYDSAIPFNAFRRQSWYRHKKALAAMSRGVRPVYPSFKDIGGGGTANQRGKVAAMLREVRASFELVGATILSDGRQSQDARPIINFLAAAKRDALLYATVQRDGSVAETARIVLRRWKAIFRSFPPKDVLTICTDSASNYTSAAKLLAKDPDPEIRRITWLPCAIHVASLMLSDIGTGVPWVIRCADFWRNVQYAVSVMTPVHQLLRRLDRGGMIMSMMYSWSQELARQVAAVDVPDDMRRLCVEAVQIRTMHMLEPAHAAAHLLNPRRHSLRYYESARRTAADLEVATECDSFFLAQTGGDAAGDAYLRVRQQMRSFHSRVGHTTDRVTRDVEAEACVGDEETSRYASWWVEHDACFPDLQEIAGRVMHMWTSASPAERNWADHERILTAKRNKLKFRKVTQLVEIATNLNLLGCSDRSGGYVLPWGHMETLAEARPDEYTHTPTTTDKDDEEEPEPKEWGARPRSAVATHEVSAQVRRFQQQGSRRPERVAEVFGPRAETLHPYDYVPPPPAEPAETSEASSATKDLRRSLRLQTQADSSTGVRREVSGHLDDITVDEHMPSQHTPTSAPPGDREQTNLRTSDFPGLTHGHSDTGFPGWGHRGERVGDDVEYRPTKAGVPESTEELHARLDREEEQRLEVLQRERAGRAAYMAEQQRAWDLETGAAVPDPGGVEHRDPFAPDLAQTEGHGDPTVPEHGDLAVSDVVLGFCAADTLQPDDVRTEETVRMEGDSDEHGDGGCGPGLEADDGADTVGRLSPSPSAGLGRLSHGPIGGDDMDLQAADPEEVGGSLQRAGVEDPISRGAAGSLGVGVRSPPLYTPVTPRYSGSPASLECEQHRSESIMVAGRGAHRAGTSSLTPPLPTVPHSTPTPVTGKAVSRGHVPTSSSPRLDTQQSFHRPWSTVRRVDDRVRGDFVAHRTRLREDSEEHRPAPSLTTGYRILDQPGHDTCRGMLLGSRRGAPAFYTSGEDGVPTPHGERHHSSMNELEARIAREEARLRESLEELDREHKRMAVARTSDADTEEEPIEVASRRERERERLVAAQARMAPPTRGRGGRGNRGGGGGRGGRGGRGSRGKGR